MSTPTAGKPVSLPSSLAAPLRSRIADGLYVTGARIPSEPKLAAELGVSRPTLREALRVLGEEGWLTRRHGSGTYVAERTVVANSIDTNFGIGELIRSAGKKPGTLPFPYRSVRRYSPRRAPGTLMRLACRGADSYPNS